MYYQLMYLFENSQKLNFPITVVVNGDGSEDHRQEFMKVYQKFQMSSGINFSMTGLIDSFGTLDGAECETQSLESRTIDWGDAKQNAQQDTLRTYTLVSKVMYSAAMTSTKSIVVVI